MGGTKQRIGIFLIAVLLTVTFLGLRVYGAYQNEKIAALASAAEAERMAATQQAAVERLQEEIECSQAWEDYKIAVLDARLAQLKQGDAAYYKAKAKAEAQKPICDGGASSVHTFSNLLIDELEAQGQARTLHTYSEVLKEYAKSRKLQTTYLAHKLCLTFTGTRATQNDLAQFLAKNQPKPKR